jgi:putative phosphoribosyl transferase
MAFRDRCDAGRRLAAVLPAFRAEEYPVVMGMARGGVPVAFEVAAVLDAPLDVVVVRKLGHPHQPELGLGAIAEDGVRVLNSALVRRLGVPDDVIDAVTRRETVELERRLVAYRGARPPIPARGRTAVVVDDGLATGFTARAAVEVARARGAARVVLAVPVAPPDTVTALGEVADDVVCVDVTEHFFGLSEWYEDFAQVSDDEVARLLALAGARPGPGDGPDPGSDPGDGPTDGTESGADR